MRSDREERGERGKKKSRSGSRTHCRSVLNQLSGSLAVPCDGTGPLWWTARCPFRLLAAGDGSSSRGQPAASPPFPAPPPTWRMAAGSGPLANGGDSSAPSRMAATPPRPRSTAASLPSHLFFHCSSTTAAGSHWRSPPLPAARSPQHRDPTQQRGLSDSVSLLPPGLRHQCNAVDLYGKKEAGTGEHLNTFNNQINKHNRKAAAPHGRLPQTKHKLKPRPGPLSSSTVVTPPFIPSGAPPLDSRPVSGAGVVHYHSLHRPRSVPTALGPAPLVTQLYSAIIESVLCTSITVWFSSASKSDLRRLRRVLRAAE